MKREEERNGKISVSSLQVSHLQHEYVLILGAVVAPICHDYLRTVHRAQNPRSLIMFVHIHSVAVDCRYRPTAVLLFFLYLTRVPPRRDSAWRLMTYIRTAVGLDNLAGGMFVHH